MKLKGLNLKTIFPFDKKIMDHAFMVFAFWISFGLGALTFDIISSPDPALDCFPIDILEEGLDVICPLQSVIRHESVLKDIHD